MNKIVKSDNNDIKAKGSSSGNKPEFRFNLKGAEVANKALQVSNGKEEELREKLGLFLDKFVEEINSSNPETSKGMIELSNGRTMEYDENYIIRLKNDKLNLKTYKENGYRSFRGNRIINFNNKQINGSNVLPNDVLFKICEILNVDTSENIQKIKNMFTASFFAVFELGKL